MYYCDYRLQPTLASPVKSPIHTRPSQGTPHTHIPHPSTGIMWWLQKLLATGIFSVLSAYESRGHEVGGGGKEASTKQPNMRMINIHIKFLKMLQ